MPEDRDLDRFIDAALGTYADPGADLGAGSCLDENLDENLAERVLARLANEPAPRPRRVWLPWAALAVPAAICSMLLLVHSGPRITKPDVTQPIQSAQLSSPDGVSVRPHPDAARPPETARQISRAAPHRHSLAATTASQPLPKLDVFPTPTPLTSQERDLAVYVAHTPQAEQQALAKSEQEPMPLTVASIHVMPLEVMPLEAPDGGANTN